MKVASDTVPASPAYEGAAPASPPSGGQVASTPVSPGALSASPGATSTGSQTVPLTSSGTDHLEGAGIDWAELISPEESPIEVDAEQTALLEALGTVATADQKLQERVLAQVLDATLPYLPENPDELSALAAETAAKLGIDLNNMSIFDLILLLLMMGMDASIKTSRQLSAGAAQSAKDKMGHILDEVSKMKDKADEGFKYALAGAALGVALSAVTVAAGARAAKKQALLESKQDQLTHARTAFQTGNRQEAGAMVDATRTLDGNYSDEGILAGLERDRKAVDALRAPAHLAAAIPGAGAALGQNAPALVQAQGQLEVGQLEADIKTQEAMFNSANDLMARQLKDADGNLQTVPTLLNGNSSAANAAADAIGKATPA